jgi:hypothetical protein
MKFIIEILAVLLVYWIIRLAVRHGVRDARKRDQP